MPEFSVISFSFRRTFSDGKMDLRSWMDACVDLGIRGLDPWGPHLVGLKDRAKPMFADPDRDPPAVELDDEELAFLDQVRADAAERDLVFGCLAGDGPSYIYEPEAWKLPRTRKLAERWIDVAARLGCAQARLDPGQWHKPEVPDEVMQTIVDGYRHLVDYGKQRNVQVLIENHWGCAAYPSVLFDILDRVEGLGLLFDTFNWAFNTQPEGWLGSAPRADALHVKCMYWTEDGEDLAQHVGHAIQLLRNAGYTGMWGIESTPRDGTSEIDGVRRTLDLIRRYLQA